MGDGGRSRPARLRRPALIALGVAAVTVLAACTTAPRVAVSSPSPSDGTAPPGTGGQATPVVGECRGPVDLKTIDAATDTRPTTACDGIHGTETFWVGEMDHAIDAWPGSDDHALAVLDNQVDQDCTNRHLDYLGYDPVASVNLPPDRLQVFAFYMPTESDFAAGARWFRCDALVEPLSAAESTTIEATLRDVYGSSLPFAYRLCEARLGQVVACDAEHEIEYIASVVLDQLTGYPLQKGDLKVTAACRTPLLDALGLTEERADLVFGYLLPTKEAWDGGSKGATCVVGTADGSPLKGSVAGIGPSAPLPVP
jgi:hypothetical protein